MSGKLYLVGTPIGNLGDFSPRAVETLQEADFIAAEDTRVTLKLLNHFGIKKPMVSYFEHNKYASGAKIFERIASGETCALVTDAGMPAISDPGEDIVRMCAANGVEVVTVPGRRRSSRQLRCLHCRRAGSALRASCPLLTKAAVSILKAFRPNAAP